MNNSTLNKKKIYSYLGEQTRIHRDRPYATEEIRRLLHGIDLLLRSIVLLLSSCGCRRARSYNYHRHQQTSTHLRIIMSQLYATCNDKGKRDGMSTEWNSAIRMIYVKSINQQENHNERSGWRRRLLQINPSRI